MWITAIVLAGGSGKRMNTDTPKQYLMLEGKPLLYYSLKAFEESLVNEVILVTKAGEEVYCQKEFVEQYGFKKVTAVVTGGKERYHSVLKGLQAIKNCDYVMIHDGARPLLTPKMIAHTIEAVKDYKACVVGMPVKDTIQIANEMGVIMETPKRSTVWQAQTPQAFAFAMVRDAYEKIVQESEVEVTDDAMVVGRYYDVPIYMVEGAYTNIKVTTPEDIPVAEVMLRLQSECRTSTCTSLNA